MVLRHVIIENRHNPLLVRSLLENEDAVEAVYGPRALDKVLRQMYDGHPAEGCLLAANDFYEGGRFEKAREYCQRARKLDPKNKQASQLLNKVNAAARAHLE